MLNTNKALSVQHAPVATTPADIQRPRRGSKLPAATALSEAAARLSVLASQPMSLLMGEMETHATQSRCPHLPHSPPPSGFLPAPLAKSLHLGVQTEEERRDITRHPF